MEIFLTIAKYFLIFILYSVCGWIIETLLYMIVGKRVVKRGFLFGPLCPIYGVGAVVCSLLFYGRIENIFLLFLLGMLLCTALEYITHFALEKLFHTTWWDYSQKKFNIKGRVCLKNSLLFGAGVVLIVRVLQPLLFNLLNRIPAPVLLTICFVLYSILLVDLATTIAGLKNTVKMLKDLQAFIGKRLQKDLDETDEHWNEMVERVKENAYFLRELQQVRGGRFSPVARLHRKYPNFTMKRYKEALRLLFENIEENKK